MYIDRPSFVLICNAQFLCNFVLEFGGILSIKYKVHPRRAIVDMLILDIEVNINILAITLYSSYMNKKIN